MRRRRLIVLTLMALIAGVALPFGVDRVARWVGPRLGPGTDPEIARLVAEEARFGAEVLDEAPAGLIYPVHVVTRVWREPGHCSGPNAGPHVVEYRATVVALTWFALPASTIDVTCGGSYWSRRMGSAQRGWTPPPSSIRPVRVTAPRDTGRYR